MKNPLLRLAPMVYGPTVLFTLGEGAVIPMIPIIATQMGADLALAALIAGLVVIGQLVGNFPASWIVARVGERVTMLIAGVVALAAAAGLLLSHELALLSISVFFMGMSGAAFGLARHSFVATRVSFTYRARALALLGGSHRFGIFVGPFIGAWVVSATASSHAVSWTFVVALVLMIALVAFGPDPESEFSRGKPVRQEGPGIIKTMIEHRGVLARLGSAAAALSSVRAARQIVLPVWGTSIGIDAETILLIVGVSGALDFALFYSSGQIMDRWGRRLAGVPSALILGAGFIALAFTHDLGSATTWYVVLSMVLGLGNGLSSGILMTVGADLAPANHPAAFLGSWRTLSDAGHASAPILFSLLAGLTTISIATGAIGVIGLYCAAGFIRWMPKYLKKP